MAAVTVVGVFPTEDAAKLALRQMDEAGFPADRVSIIANNVRQAREVAGSRSYTGALIGATIGVGVGVALALASTMSLNNLAAIPLGVVMFALAGAFIGWLAGRAKVLKAGDSDKYQRAVDMGDALVSIRCEGDERGPAERALSAAGAIAVRVEGTPESV